jgi:hypothetical protein
MKYQHGITRDEPSLAIFEATGNCKQFAMIECVLILAMCLTIVLLPILGFLGLGI